MTLTLLLDLDDTLLGNDMDVFLKSYLPLLARKMAHHVEPSQMLPNLGAAIEAMVRKNDPQFTLEETFDAHFYPAIGRTKEELDNLLTDFYDHDFLTVQSVTTFRPGAVALVEEAFRRGYRVVVATNPLFPRAAIEHRLEWAGLPVDQYPFDLVTNFNDFHFTKSTAAYYAEILTRLGWVDGPVAMVGDMLQEDILSSIPLGIYGYWLNGDLNHPSLQPVKKQVACGTLDGVMDWLDAVEQTGNRKSWKTPAAITETLKAIPAGFDAQCRALQPADWLKRPAEGEWCLTEILCHLRDVDREVNIPRVQRVLSEENPFIPGMVTDIWASERNYASEDGKFAFDGFLSARSALVKTLETLDDPVWERPARHALLGPTHLTEMAEFIVTHDINHVQQAACIRPLNIHTISSHSPL